MGGLLAEGRPSVYIGGHMKTILSLALILAVAAVWGAIIAWTGEPAALGVGYDH